MNKSLEQQQKELLEKRQQFDKEREAWEEAQKQDEQRRSLENSKSDTGSFKMSFPRFK